MWIRQIFNVLIYIFACIGFVLVVGYIAVSLKLTNTAGVIDTQTKYFKNQGKTPATKPEWVQSEEWQILKQAILADKEDIYKAAEVADIAPRLLVSQLVVEQLRLYHSNRQLFKEVFAPLKLLGNQSQFSWGIMGLKQETAITIENNLKDPSSPFYLGNNYEHMLDFTTEDPDKERFERIVNEKEHYYSYLYATLNLKELENQWEKAGFSIKNRPEILSTLYNIGFSHSQPNANPQVGGAEIKIDEKTYSFGGLAYDFYYSDELTAEFPR